MLLALGQDDSDAIQLPKSSISTINLIYPKLTGLSSYPARVPPRARRNQGNRASLNPASEPVRARAANSEQEDVRSRDMPVAASSRVTHVPRAAAARARLALARPVVAAHQRPTLPFEIHRKGAAAGTYGVHNMRVWRRTKGKRSPRRGTRRGHAPTTPRGKVEARRRRPD